MEYGGLSLSDLRMLIYRCDRVAKEKAGHDEVLSVARTCRDVIADLVNRKGL